MGRAQCSAHGLYRYFRFFLPGQLNNKGDQLPSQTDARQNQTKIGECAIRLLLSFQLSKPGLQRGKSLGLRIVFRRNAGVHNAAVRERKQEAAALIDADVRNADAVCTVETVHSGLAVAAVKAVSSVGTVFSVDAILPIAAVKTVLTVNTIVSILTVFAVFSINAIFAIDAVFPVLTVDAVGDREGIERSVRKVNGLIVHVAFGAQLFNAVDTDAGLTGFALLALFTVFHGKGRCAAVGKGDLIGVNSGFHVRGQ